MMSTFTLNMIQSYIHGVPWQLSYPGLLNFGQFSVSNVALNWYLILIPNAYTMPC